MLHDSKLSWVELFDSLVISDKFYGILFQNFLLLYILRGKTQFNLFLCNQTAFNAEFKHNRYIILSKNMLEHSETQRDKFNMVVLEAYILGPLTI